MLQCTSNVTDCAPIWRRRLAMMLVLCLLSMGAVGVAMGAAARQKSFPTPEEGVRALIEAAQRHDTTTLLAILGPEAQSIVSTGDPVSDRASGEHFVKSYEEAHTLVQSGDTKVVLQIGKDEWPFPIPLIKGSAGWRFDTPAGGRDPQAAHRTQRARRHPGVPGLCRRATRILRAQPPERYATAYAPKFISTKGKRDGLYWETSANEPPSPWGPLVAQPDARATSVPPASLCPITATITKCSPGRDPTRRVAPMTIWCVAR